MSTTSRLVPASSRTLLLTLDAFGTLFHPRLPVPEQYAATAHQFGLSPTAITPNKLKTAFKDTFREQSHRYPNYGRADVLRGQYGGPRQWWEEVIRGSFTRVLAADNPTPLGEPQQYEGQIHNNIDLPAGMMEALLDRFANLDGYALYDDVVPFFQRMRKLKAAGKWSYDRIIVGVISNSDDRVPAVLRSLGLEVGDVRADQDRSSMELPGFEHRAGTDKAHEKSFVELSDQNLNIDIDMVITSYEAGEEKPHRLMFDVAKRQALLVSRPWITRSTKFSAIHVGDDLQKDCRAARAAGWQTYFMPRDHFVYYEDDVKEIGGLLNLMDKLELAP
jgi:FMN phosphatase YigB (HAD superfamily)